MRSSGTYNLAVWFISPLIGAKCCLCLGLADHSQLLRSKSHQSIDTDMESMPYSDQSARDRDKDKDRDRAKDRGRDGERDRERPLSVNGDRSGDQEVVTAHASVAWKI